MIFERVQQWRRFRPQLLEAMARGDGSHTEDDVIGRILTGEYKLWCFEKCAFVTFVWVRPQFKALSIFLAAGDLDALRACQRDLEVWAAACGCKKIYSCGRVGWERVFPDYKNEGVLYSKELA